MCMNTIDFLLLTFFCHFNTYLCLEKISIKITFKYSVFYQLNSKRYRNSNLQFNGSKNYLRPKGLIC